MRISTDRSIPEHYESVPLKPVLQATGWLLAAGGIAGGIALAATTEGSIARIGAPLLALAGGVVLATMRHCRQLEITVGSKRIDLGSGPFRQTVPTGAVESTEIAAATGWRKLFARREVTLKHGFGSGTTAVPSADPEAIVEVVRRIAGI